MKTRLSGLLPFFALGALAVAASCSGTGKGNATGNRLFTDSVSYVDSAKVGCSSTKVSITGLYPAGGPGCLVDSTRQWIATQLCIAAGANDGQKLVDSYGSQLLDSFKNELDDYAADGICISSEYMAEFRPVYHTDSLTTYLFKNYQYEGGAHGISLASSRTFVNSSGIALTADEIFLPESKNAVIAMVKDALWSQYFKEIADEWSRTFGEMLLINPDSLNYPTLPPYFMKDGITFTYQQYEIAPYAAGMPSCVLPYNAVRHLLRPAAAALIPKGVEE